MHASMYPTVARITLDILPVPAATVGVESLFSRGKEVMADRCSRLDPALFKQLQCLHYHWSKETVDWALVNSEEMEEIELCEYEYLEVHEELVAVLEDDA